MPPRPPSRGSCPPPAASWSKKGDRSKEKCSWKVGLRVLLLPALRMCSTALPRTKCRSTSSANSAADSDIRPCCPGPCPPAARAQCKAAAAGEGGGSEGRERRLRATKGSIVLRSPPVPGKSLPWCNSTFSSHRPSPTPAAAAASQWLIRSEPSHSPSLPSFSHRRLALRLASSR